MAPIMITEGDAVVSEIHIERGILTRVGSLLPPNPGRRRVVLLTQPTVMTQAEQAERSLSSAGYRPTTITLPDGDAAKSFSVVESVARELNELMMGRSDTIIGLGGGAATDVAGFIAATYLRGIECVLAPTTLLGAVDASVGGKTGINVGGKNLVGAFRHPARILIDVDVLEGLPASLIRQGSAEALKTGFIGDPKLVDLYREHGLAAPLGEVVERAVAVKAGVVSQDFREGGVRAVLNYGHTVGHGVEIAAGISHGEAVAIGMVAAGYVGERMVGFEGRTEHDGLIASLGLPTSSPGLERRTVENLMALDKKRDAEGIRFVVLRDIGEPMVVHPDDATVRAALAAIGID